VLPAAAVSVRRSASRSRGCNPQPVLSGPQGAVSHVQCHRLGPCARPIHQDDFACRASLHHRDCAGRADRAGTDDPNFHGTLTLTLLRPAGVPHLGEVPTPQSTGPPCHSLTTCSWPGAGTMEAPKTEAVPGRSGPAEGEQRNVEGQATARLGRWISRNGDGSAARSLRHRD
jgi:hypothetical protein